MDWHMSLAPIALTGVASLVLGGGAVRCGQQTGSIPRAGELVSAGSMHSARAAHTATLLPDGRVLLAGGLAAGAVSAEIYDPESGAFAVAPPLVTPRHSHTATRLDDGRVLLTGGHDDQGGYLASAEIFDPTTGEFAPAAPMTTARANHLAVLLDDGRVLLVGGVGTGWTFLSSAEIYDPGTGGFRATGGMSEPRESHAVVRLLDGRVFVVGGHHGRRADLRLLASAEMYDPASGIFGPAGSMSTPRHKHDALLLPDGRVLITGGADERDSRGVYRSTEALDPATGVFEPAGDMRLGRYKHRGTSIVLPDGRVLLAGGAAQAELYEPTGGSSSLVPGTTRLSGQFSAAALLADGRVLITGGYGPDIAPQGEAWLYSP